MSQNFDHIEPISINNNDISDDNLLKDMVRNLNGKKNISNQNTNKISEEKNKGNKKERNNNNLNSNKNATQLNYNNNNDITKI